MLIKRLITGLLLVFSFLLVLSVPPLYVQSIIFAVVAILGSWEWAGLVGLRAGLSKLLYSLVLLALCCVCWVIFDLAELDGIRSRVRPWLAASALFWSAMLLGLKYYPSGRWLWRKAYVKALMGWGILASTWLAVVFCLSLPNGRSMLFLMVFLVAVADIVAYFVGQKFGRHPLAPAISPNKTWEGFWGGLLSVLMLSMLIGAALPPLYLYSGEISLILLGIFTAGASVVGDLTVSLIKREMGVKDSGSLLPGHGGLLDRLDSLCAAAPVFAVGLLLAGY